MKLGEYKQNIFIKIDEYEPNNTEWYTDDDDLQAKFPVAFNEAIRFVFYGKSERKKWNVYQDATINQIPNTQDVYTHTNEDISFSVDGAKAYYFEVCDKATITITDANGELLRIENPAVQNRETIFKAYKGRLDDAEGTVTITFSGDCYFKFRNIALYNVAFSTDDNVPEYSRWCEHDIPENMYQIMNVRYITNTDNDYCDYKIEGNKLLLPADNLGRYEVESNFFPDEITAETSNDKEIPIPIDCIFPVVSKCSAILTQEGSEYTEHISDSEQYMQMLDDSRTKSRIRVRERIDF